MDCTNSEEACGLKKQELGDNREPRCLFWDILNGFQALKKEESGLGNRGEAVVGQAQMAPLTQLD